MTTTPVSDRIRRRKQNELLRARGVTNLARIRRYASPADQAEARRRLAELRAATITIPAIAAKTGLAPGTVARINRGEDVAIATAKAVLALSVDDFTDARRFTAAELIWHLGTLRAQGYGTPWIEATAGISPGVLELAWRRAHRGQLHYASEDLTRRLVAIHAKHADAAATVHNTGQEPKQIKRIKTLARNAGHYPAAAYAEDGTLDWRAIPDHPWAVADEACHTRIEDLRTILANPDLGSRAIASLVLGSDEPTAEHEAVDKRLDRVVKRFDLRVGAPGSAERRAELEDAVWRFYRRSDTTPVAFVLDHGLVDVKHARDIPRDHPDLIAHPLFVAWQKERVEGRKATRQRENQRMKATRAASRAADAQVAA